MRIFFLLIFSLIFIIPFKAGAEEIINKDESLSLTRCIEIAIKRQPNIAAAMYTVDVNQSKVGQAKANYYPQLNWSSGYSKISSSSGTSKRVLNDSSASRFSATTGSPFDQYSSGFTLNQNIFDFGKTQTQVNIQGLNLDSSRSDLENVLEQIIFNVKQSYFGLLAAKRNRDVAEETVTQFQLHLDQAKGFYEVGTKPKFDVTKAEVDLSNAKLNLIRAENSLKIAKANLNDAMGLPEAPDYTVEDNLSFLKFETTFEESMERAYKNRSDLKSIIAQKKAAEASIGLSKKGYFPVVTGNAAYDWLGEKFPLERGWNVGVVISFPLFNGFLTKHQVEESTANLSVLQKNEDSLRQSVFLEVKQACLNLKEAEERIPTAEITVKQAEENLNIANGRYAAGLGNPIEVTDAEVSLSNAKVTYIQALYDYKVAQASLEKAMGIR